MQLNIDLFNVIKVKNDSGKQNREYQQRNEYVQVCAPHEILAIHKLQFKLCRLKFTIAHIIHLSISTVMQYIVLDNST